MALFAASAATLGLGKKSYTNSAPLASATISTVLAADGVTIVIGDTADKSSVQLANTIDRLRDYILEQNK